MPAKDETVSPVSGNYRPSGRGNGSSKPRTNWKKTAQRLEEELEIAKLRHQELMGELTELKLSAPSLAEREAIKLRRLEHIMYRVLNAPLCTDCKPWLDNLIEQEIQYVNERAREMARRNRGPEQPVG